MPRGGLIWVVLKTLFNKWAIHSDELDWISRNKKDILNELSTKHGMPIKDYLFTLQDVYCHVAGYF